MEEADEQRPLHQQKENPHQDSALLHDQQQGTTQNCPEHEYRTMYESPRRTPP
jgi:hypothetical protein